MKKFLIKVNNKSYEVEVEEVGGSTHAAAPITTASTAQAPVSMDSTAPSGSTEVVAPMPGNIINVKVAKGDKVNEGDVLLILEAMKMENNILAEKEGIVNKVLVSVGDTVLQGDILVEIE
ncbi:MAG: biotin/lipoyl-binding protein [Clostridiales bacterium]|nr:biotin/lipoyl-binding protein [Clostridiales bacterium]